MKNVSKKVITILITGMFLLSIIPVVHAAITLDSDAPTAGTRYNVGDTIVTTGTGVTSGAVVNLYWDYVTTAGLMNNTQGNPSGTFEVSVDVPETPAGEHWIWVKDMETSLSVSVRVVVVPELDLSSTSGLVGEDLTADGTGFMDDDDISIYFGTPPVFLVEADDSTADWATDPQTTPSGYGDAVKLVGDALSDARAGVLIASGPTMDTITLGNLGFDYYALTGAVGVPEFELTIVNPDCVNPYDASSNNRAHVQMTIDTPGALTTNAWTTSTAITGAETVTVFGNEADGTPFGPITGNWATVVTAIKVIEPTAGDWVVTRVAPQAGWSVTGTYYIDLVTAEAATYNLTEPVDTDTSGDEGSWETTFDVPDLPDDTTYAVSAVSSGDFWDSHDFTIGAVITIDVDEGPTGTIVTITGRGFTTTSTLASVQLTGTDMPPVEDLVTDVDVVAGEFEAEFVVPDVAIGDYEITVTDAGAKTAVADFEVNGVPEIEVDPTYGSPGAVITITGSNFTRIEGTEVYVTMNSAPVSDLVTAETDEDGNFEATFVSPAVTFTTYTVTADDEYSIDATDAFKVGLIALIVNPTSGEAGTEMAITGIGFEDGSYNLTFGDELYEDHGTVASEAISDTFFIPNVEPGTYTIVVVDTADNELSAQFTVTHATAASVEPGVAPTTYNITLSGENFADVVGDVDFAIYNSTDEWDMLVYEDGAGSVPAATDSDGNFTGWWLVDTALSIGEYTINVTDSEDLMMQLPFSVVAARVEVTPRKALFDRGDAVSFVISNDFVLDDSYIEVYSPDDTLWWITEPFGDGTPNPDVWVLNQDDLYTVPKYLQTANMNEMELASDAPMGTWTYFFYDNADDELMNGTFVVGASTAAQIDELLDDVRSDIESLAGDLGGVTDDLEDDVADLSTEIGGIISDMENLRDDIVGDLADDIAAATDAGNEASAAVDDLNDALGDLGDAVSDLNDMNADLSDELDAVSDDTSAAREAAEDAQQAASGLTTLVYGAIGASLIAALAAIISLMQISRRIAG